jgi:Tfp pilus assembly protein PilF
MPDLDASQRASMAVSPKRQSGPSSLGPRTRPTWSDRLRASRRPLVLASLLVGATLLVYAQTWWFGYVLIDDPIEVSGNPRVQAGPTLQNFVWCFTSFFDGNWIPLTWLSLMLDTKLFGFRAGGYHFTNVLFHAANTVLLFVFLARATGSELRSACVAALFALHPLHVESVAWITERKDVLSLFFGLLSLLAYVRYAKSRGRLPYALCLSAFVASLLSKQTLVTLPFLLLLLDFWPLGRMQAKALARLSLEKLPFLAVSIVFSVVTVFAQKVGNGMQTLVTIPFSVRIENAVVAYAAYLEKTFVPRDLVVYYPHPGGAFSWLAIGISAAVLLAVSGAAIASVRRLPYFFVGWSWFLGTLVPMIGLVQVGSQQMADRYTYFPLIGLFIALVWLIADLVPAGALRTGFLPVATLCGLAALAATAFVQVGYWRDDLALFRHALEGAEDNPFTRNKIGCALVQRGELSEAIDQFQHALRLGPNWVDPQYNLGLVYQRQGHPDDAAACYRKVLVINDQHADAHNNLGAILLDRGANAEAKQHFQRAAQIAPTRVEPERNLAAVSLKTGDYAEAIAASQRALAIDPRQLECRYILVEALLAQRRWDEAAQQLEIILKLNPGDGKARSELIRTLSKRHGL